MTNEHIAEFMSLYHDLNRYYEENNFHQMGAHSRILEKAAQDPDFKELCKKIYRVAAPFGNSEEGPETYTAPANPAFVKAWRDYEFLYEHDVAQICGATMRWENREYQAEYAKQVVQEFNLLLNNFVSNRASPLNNDDLGTIRDFFLVFSHLTHGLDIEGMIRRIDKVPFVNVPTQVSNKHGAAEKMSLLTHLQEAHRAFVLGLPFAALAMMRSILETVLKDNYTAFNKDNLVGLIDSCTNLPDGAHGVLKEELHDLRKLANTVLHLNKKAEAVPHNQADFEIKIGWHLETLRNLIEGAPA